jgi:four helix bundle protein
MMARNHRNLDVFNLADALVIEMYKLTAAFPPEERYGLQSQLRRGAVSIPTNIVEGCARPTERDYLHFKEIAFGSASEVSYLLTVAYRLTYLSDADAGRMGDSYDKVVRMLRNLIDNVRLPGVSR